MKYLFEKNHGEDRLDSQYFRVNIDPLERYVLSEAGSSQYRLAADESGFSNLYLTGDWTSCGLNAGCMEASVIWGLLTAIAVSGETLPIYGGYELPKIAKSESGAYQRAS